MRGIPPHLLALGVLLIGILWFVFLGVFRRSRFSQGVIAKTLADDTPENALADFRAAKARLEQHLDKSVMDGATRRKIRAELYVPAEDAVAADK